MTIDLERRVERLEGDMEATQAILKQLAESQARTDRIMAEMGQRVDQVSQRIDSFVFEAQRIFATQGDRLSRVEAAIETMVSSYQRLDRNAEADRAEMRNTHQRMDSMISRLDTLVDYLVRNQP